MFWRTDKRNRFKKTHTIHWVDKRWAHTKTYAHRGTHLVIVHKFHCCESRRQGTCYFRMHVWVYSLTVKIRAGCLILVQLQTLISIKFDARNCFCDSIVSKGSAPAHRRIHAKRRMQTVWILFCHWPAKHTILTVVYFFCSSAFLCLLVKPSFDIYYTTTDYMWLSLSLNMSRSV